MSSKSTAHFPIKDALRSQIAHMANGSQPGRLTVHRISEDRLQIQWWQFEYDEYESMLACRAYTRETRESVRHKFEERENWHVAGDHRCPTAIQASTVPLPADVMAEATNVFVATLTVGVWRWHETPQPAKVSAAKLLFAGPLQGYFCWSFDEKKGWVNSERHTDGRPGEIHPEWLPLRDWDPLEGKPGRHFWLPYQINPGRSIIHPDMLAEFEIPEKKNKK
jgi:hypothetical protein